MAWMMWHAAPDRRLPEIKRVLADVPEDLARTIQKLIAKPQSQRYKSADEALSDLNIDLKLVKTGEESAENLGRPGTKGPANKRRMMIIGAFAVSAILSLAVLLIPSGNSTPPVTHPKSLIGIIREVKPQEGKLIIEDEQGVPEEIQVGKKPRIRLSEFDKVDDKYVLLDELEPRDRLEIRFEESGERRTAIITVLRPTLSSGKIKEVDAEGKKLVATLAADPQPQDVPMYVPSGAKLLLNGKLATLADLRPDDRIEIFHLKDTKDRAPRAVIKLEARRTQSLTGFVKSVTPRNDKLWLFVDHLRTEAAVECSDAVRVTINGQGEEDGRKYSATDLKKGDRVHVWFDTHASKIAAIRCDSLTGTTLKKIDQSSREIVVQPDNADLATFAIGDMCEITRDDKRADFTDLRDGDVLDITFEPQPNGPATAMTIDARPSR
jgi:Cu/Ag efflux protein CusF